MGFVLNTEEKFAEGLRRITYELLDDAETQLQDLTDDPSRRVHSARKDLKKLRAVLRLARSSIGERAYRRENDQYRLLANRLAGARESHVALNALDGILSRNTDLLESTSFDSLRQHLQENEAAQSAALLEDAALFEEVRATLGKSRKRVKKWDLSQKPHKLIKRNLLRVYSRGRDEMHTALTNLTADNLHEWRKRVKYLGYHLQILQPIWDAGLNAYICELDDLGELLGQDHDYAELKQLVYQLPDLFTDTDEMMTLVYQLDVERRALQQAAFVIGERVYVEEPKPFAKRHQDYWRAWHGERHMRAALLLDVDNA